MKFWLIKSEPDAFSIEDMKAKGVEHWDGIRNYQARNFMMKEMEIGDYAIFYHSNAKPPGCVGVVKVVSKPYPDHTAWDSNAKYFDPKSTEENPRWFMVDFEFVGQFDEMVSLQELKDNADDFEGMLLLRKGSRLSITPVESKHFARVLKMANFDLPL